MKKRENSFKRYLVNLMGTRWHVQSHEDRYSLGIPDLSYGINGINGWIELKQIEKWPKNDDTPVAPKKYTSLQVNWIISRGKKGGNCYIMIKVKNDYFIFDWRSARMIKNGMTKNEYIKKALAFWQGQVVVDEFCQILSLKRHGNSF